MEWGDVARASSFDCGDSTITDWIKNQTYGWQSHNSGAARVYVSLDSSGKEIAGYYSLSSGAAELIEAPARIGQDMPTQVPIQLIGRLGVDQRLRRQGIGRYLVLHALKTTVEISKMTGVRAVMVESKPDAIGLYKKLRFEQSDSDPMLFFFMVKDMRKALDQAGIAY